MYHLYICMVFYGNVTFLQVLINAVGNRQNIGDLIIVLSDGIPNEKAGQTRQEASITKSSGIRIVSVGISSLIDLQLLRDIATDSSQVRPFLERTQCCWTNAM